MMAGALENNKEESDINLFNEQIMDEEESYQHNTGCVTSLT